MLLYWASARPSPIHQPCQSALWYTRVGGETPSPLEATQPLKTREGSARSAAFSKLRTRARKNCEHAHVELGGIETQKSVRDVRLDR